VLLPGTGFHSVATFRAPITRLATIRITSWQTALKCTADCKAPTPWQSVLKLSLLTMAIRSTVIFFMSICNLKTAVWQGQQCTFERFLNKITTIGHSRHTISLHYPLKDAGVNRKTVYSWSSIIFLTLCIMAKGLNYKQHLCSHE
jgi:hypothetical protein